MMFIILLLFFSPQLRDSAAVPVGAVPYVYIGPLNLRGCAGRYISTVAPKVWTYVHGSLEGSWWLGATLSRQSDSLNIFG